MVKRYLKKKKETRRIEEKELLKIIKQLLIDNCLRKTNLQFNKESRKKTNDLERIKTLKCIKETMKKETEKKLDSHHYKKEKNFDLMVQPDTLLTSNEISYSNLIGAVEIKKEYLNELRKAFKINDNLIRVKMQNSENNDKIIEKVKSSLSSWAKVLKNSKKGTDNFIDLNLKQLEYDINQIKDTDDSIVSNIYPAEDDCNRTGENEKIVTLKGDDRENNCAKTECGADNLENQETETIGNDNKIGIKVYNMQDNEEINCKNSFIYNGLTGSIDNNVALEVHQNIGGNGIKINSGDIFDEKEKETENNYSKAVDAGESKYSVNKNNLDNIYFSEECKIEKNGGKFLYKENEIINSEHLRARNLKDEKDNVNSYSFEKDEDLRINFFKKNKKDQNFEDCLIPMKKYNKRIDKETEMQENGNKNKNKEKVENNSAKYELKERESSLSTQPISKKRKYNNASIAKEKSGNYYYIKDGNNEKDCKILSKEECGSACYNSQNKNLKIDNKSDNTTHKHFKTTNEESKKENHSDKYQNDSNIDENDNSSIIHGNRNNHLNDGSSKRKMCSISTDIIKEKLHVSETKADKSKKCNWVDSVSTCNPRRYDNVTNDIGETLFKNNNRKIKNEDKETGKANDLMVATNKTRKINIQDNACVIPTYNIGSNSKDHSVVNPKDYSAARVISTSFPTQYVNPLDAVQFHSSLFNPTNHEQVSRSQNDNNQKTYITRTDYIPNESRSNNDQQKQSHGYANEIKHSQSLQVDNIQDPHSIMNRPPRPNSATRRSIQSEYIPSEPSIHNQEVYSDNTARESIQSNYVPSGNEREDLQSLHSATALRRNHQSDYIPSSTERGDLQFLHASTSPRRNLQSDYIPSSTERGDLQFLHASTSPRRNLQSDYIPSGNEREDLQPFDTATPTRRSIQSDYIPDRTEREGSQLFDTAISPQSNLQSDYIPNRPERGGLQFHHTASDRRRNARYEYIPNQIERQGSRSNQRQESTESFNTQGLPEHAGYQHTTVRRNIDSEYIPNQRQSGSMRFHHQQRNIDSDYIPNVRSRSSSSERNSIPNPSQRNISSENISNSTRSNQPRSNTGGSTGRRLSFVDSIRDFFRDQILVRNNTYYLYPITEYIRTLLRRSRNAAANSNPPPTPPPTANANPNSMPGQRTSSQNNERGSTSSRRSEYIPRDRSSSRENTINLGQFHFSTGNQNIDNDLNNHVHLEHILDNVENYVSGVIGGNIRQGGESDRIPSLEELHNIIITYFPFYKIKKRTVKKKNLDKTKIIKKKKDDGFNSCVICFDDYMENEKIRILNCNHDYHKDCIDKWLCNYNNACPNCRKVV